LILSIGINELYNKEYFANARHNMVYNQLVPNGITDERVIGLLLKIPRHKFIMSKWKNVAYSDSILPIWNTDSFTGYNRFIMPPFVLAKMLQDVEINANSSVLDFNCNTGYSSMIISNIAKKVAAVDIDRKLLKIGMSQELLSQAKDNVMFQALDYFEKNSKGLEFDIIFINGIMNDIPKYIKDILVDGGRIILIERKNNLAKIVKWTKHNNNLFKEELLAVDADERLLVNVNIPHNNKIVFKYSS
jgi:protein-L-isoaspartate(D-aspartate) O-methyltransferase